MTTMCKLITLFTIDSIFQERLEKSISWKAKMLYINCLNKRFKDLDATERNAQEFELWYADMKNFDKWESSFRELHEAKLITLSTMYVTFHNMWGQYIDRSLLDKEDGKRQSSILTKEQIELYLNENTALIETVCMRNRIKQERIPQLVQEFIQEQSAFKNVYFKEQEVSRHFTFWVPHYLQHNGKQNSKQPPKMLGEK